MLAESSLDPGDLYGVNFEQIQDKISLFGGLNSRQLDLILPYLTTAELYEGDTVFRQGQLPCNVYIVINGQIGLRIRRDDNTEYRLTLGVGDSFGETSVIGIQPQIGCAEVEKHTRLLVLSRACLFELARYDQEVFGILIMNVAREVSRRLHALARAPLTS